MLGQSQSTSMRGFQTETQEHLLECDSNSIGQDTGNEGNGGRNSQCADRHTNRETKTKMVEIHEKLSPSCVLAQALIDLLPAAAACSLLGSVTLAPFCSEAAESEV
ncbi:uncharacterized protein MEPE_01309 [Melanopsichium pennsylvanicum]|uniref:Uncharacterized protein n=1 Tax=Melanopsichium pennsylvanicum TaxID=63383 RepID=A0AAJ5C3K0_9BASI|nr:uncharacterized protein MEPE_01309 [Melanopsichium pennsylvanicum]